MHFSPEICHFLWIGSSKLQVLFLYKEMFLQWSLTWKKNKNNIVTVVFLYSHYQQYFLRSFFLLILYRAKYHSNHMEQLFSWFSGARKSSLLWSGNNDKNNFITFLLYDWLQEMLMKVWVLIVASISLGLNFLDYY